MNSYQDYKMAKIKWQDFKQQKSVCMHLLCASHTLCFSNTRMNKTTSLAWECSPLSFRPVGLFKKAWNSGSILNSRVNSDVNLDCQLLIKNNNKKIKDLVTQASAATCQCWLSWVMAAPLHASPLTATGKLGGYCNFCRDCPFYCIKISSQNKVYLPVTQAWGRAPGPHTSSMAFITMWP